MLKSQQGQTWVTSHSAALTQETRYVFLPDHDRDYLLMKAAATHAPVERGPERSKEWAAPTDSLIIFMLHPLIVPLCIICFILKLKNKVQDPSALPCPASARLGWAEVIFEHFQLNLTTIIMIIVIIFATIICPKVATTLWYLCYFSTYILFCAFMF